MTSLIEKGTFGAAVFTCTEALATYQELESKGVILKSRQQKTLWICGFVP
ncbi:MAG TPA: hypothetical protein VNV85_08770 [Puia sp.]|jgi:hypothetical protein|nr:hypothetical protein [Puia sp.]